MIEVGYLSTQDVRDATVAVWNQQRYVEPDTAGNTWDYRTNYRLPTANALHPAASTAGHLTSFISRYYVSHNAPENATYARLRANVYAQRTADDDAAFMPFTVRRGVWGASTTPLFGDYGEVLYTQSIPAYYGPAAPVDWVAYPIDVLIPTFDDESRCQFTIEGFIDLGWAGQDPASPVLEQHQVNLRAPGPGVVSPGELAKYHLDFYSGIAGVPERCTCLPFQNPIFGIAEGTDPVGRYVYMGWGADGTIEGTAGNVPSSTTASSPLFRVGTYWEHSSFNGWTVLTTYNEIPVPPGTTRVRIEQVVTTQGWGGPSGGNEPGPPFYTFFAKRHDWGATLTLPETDSSLGETIGEFTVPNLNGVTETFPGVTMPLAIEFDLYPGQTEAQWSFWPRSDCYAVPFLLTRDFSQPHKITFYGNGATSGTGTMPTNNQPIEDEAVGVGDNTATAFTTDWPYNPSSLQVTVDGLLVPADQTNPLTGQFTLGFAPETGEVVIASYRYQEPP